MDRRSACVSQLNALDAQRGDLGLKLDPVGERLQVRACITRPGLDVGTGHRHGLLRHQRIVLLRRAWLGLAFAAGQASRRGARSVWRRVHGHDLGLEQLVVAELPGG